MPVMLITCTDNLNRFSDTIRTVFPQSSTQICVVYQIWNSGKYVVYKDKKELMVDMKNIYNVPNKEVAAAKLDNLKKKRRGRCVKKHTFFLRQSPDFHKLGLCYYLKILYV